MDKWLLLCETLKRAGLLDEDAEALDSGHELEGVTARTIFEMVRGGCGDATLLLDDRDRVRYYLRGDAVD